MWLWNTNAHGGNKNPKLAISSIKAMVNVTRSFTLVLFERVSLVEVHAKYEVSISYDSKVMAKVIIFLQESQSQTDRVADRLDKN